MLNRCYKAELSKMLKGKGIYIALAVMVGIVILYSVLSSVLFEGSGIVGSFDDGFLDILKDTPREEYPILLATHKSQLEQLESDNNTMWSRFIDTKGYYEGRMAVIQYLIDNPSVDVGTLTLPSMGVFAMAENSLNFMMNAISLVTEIAIVYVAIVMSSILAGEMRDGTLRMQLLRPNSRRKILTSKWLAAFTVGVGLMTIGVILSGLYSAIHFKENVRDVLCVVANAHVTIMGSGLYIFIAFIFAALSIFAMTSFTMFLCGISRYNRSISMALPIVTLMLGGLSAMILQVAYLGVIDFPYSLNLMNFMTMSEGGLPNTSLFTALPVLLVYTAIFMIVGYITFDKVEL